MALLKLAHIVYSNCFPPHAAIVTGKIPFPFTIVDGIPSQLNRMLYEGAIDVSPSSSIEYARNAGRYLLLPDLSITSKKEVRSIILQSRVPIEELSGKKIALTTASATSVVLLRVLLEMRYSVKAGYTAFEQEVEDPFRGADAALFIGDLALKTKPTKQYPYLFDLGRLWHEFTGLPFVFALWQVNYKKNLDKDLEELYDILIKSKSYGLSHISELAYNQGHRFGLSGQVLTDYWNLLSYDLRDDEKKGLMAFYGYAAEIGAIKAVPELRFWEKR